MWIPRITNCMYFEMFAFFIFLVELVVILEVNWMSLAHFCSIKHGGILLPVQIRNCRDTGLTSVTKSRNHIGIGSIILLMKIAIMLCFKIIMYKSKTVQITCIIASLFFTVIHLTNTKVCDIHVVMLKYFKDEDIYGTNLTRK